MRYKLKLIKEKFFLPIFSLSLSSFCFWHNDDDDDDDAATAIRLRSNFPNVRAFGG